MGGRGSSSGKTGSPGDVGTGVLISSKNSSGGSKKTYLFVNEQNQVMKMSGRITEPYKMNGKIQKGEILKKMVERGAEFLSKKEISKLKKNQKKKRESAKSVDYELGFGTGFGNKANRKAARQGRLMSRGQK